MSGGIHRADLALIGAVAATTGLPSGFHTASAIASETVPVDHAVRWFEVALLWFEFRGSLAYLTPTDLIAVLSAGILLIRFAAWAFMPFCRLFKRGKHGKN